MRRITSKGVCPNCGNQQAEYKWKIDGFENKVEEVDCFYCRIQMIKTDVIYVKGVSK